MFSNCFALDDYALKVLAMYGFEYPIPPNAVICFQVVPHSEIDDFTKCRAALTSQEEMKQLAEKINVLNFDSMIVDPFGVPRSSQFPKWETIDFIALCQRHLKWKTDQKSGCYELIHPEYEQKIYVGGMLVTNIPQELIEKLTHSQKVHFEKIAA